jgi:OOP family OmpA-OmpF porin
LRALLAIALAIAVLACARAPAPVAFSEGVVTSAGVLVLPGRVAFATATADLTPEGAAVLGVALDFLRRQPAVTLLRIEAHTDDKGGRDFVLRLQSRRAQVVAAWLVARGVDCRRLLPVVVDDRPPVVCNDCDPGPRPNRHIELHVATMGDAPAFGPAPEGSAPAGDPCAPAGSGSPWPLPPRPGLPP